MRKAANINCLSMLLVVALLLSLMPLVIVRPVSAHPGKLTWSIVNTPNNTDNSSIASPSELNIIAIGFDGRTFYAVDISNGDVHKSTDGGITWRVNLSASLATAGANLPVWNLVVAPDDVNFLVAITDGGVGTPGPLGVFASEDGGANWQNTNFTPVPGEYISSVDISVNYGSNNRDIAIGTRTGGGGGRVYVRKYPVSAAWADQTVLPSTGWFGGDVVALKFSPTYTGDSSLVVVSSAADTRLQLGSRDTGANTTNWNIVGGYPVLIHDVVQPGTSPTSGQIITADLELPSDFSGSDPSLRRFYVSTDATVAGVQFGVYRVDNIVVFWIKPPTTAPTTGRISSIAYYGTYAEGVLLAGEVEADPITGMAFVWRASDLTSNPPAWQRSDTYKSPTGGATSGFANVQVAWHPEGTVAYCGTSSACLGVFNLPNGVVNCAVLTEWPDGYLNSFALDESAFSVSPYAPAYRQLLISVSFAKTPDTDIGNVWNQLSLIDTGMTAPTFLSDVDALEVPDVSGGGAPSDYDILYLISVNTGGFESIWRSTSDPLGRTWERVLCTAAGGTGAILRVKQRPYESSDRSDCIVFANLGTNRVGYSEDEGQMWDVRSFGVTGVTDLALPNDDVIYILDNTTVYRYENSGSGWIETHSEQTGLAVGHTIAVPLEISGVGASDEDWVIVGEAGPPSGFSRVVWADFSETIVDFAPPASERVEVPVPGNVHVIADDKFLGNKIVYAATHDVANTSGSIYRWTIDSSTDWAEPQPPNSAFYGLAQRNNVLYGAWRNPQVPAILGLTAGVDRTIYPRVTVPPPTEWDYLTVGLPINVIFTREPSSLKVSSNEDNDLWAIDNRAYDWINSIGCLWACADTVAKVGPWTTSPASGDFIPVDPVTGRATEIDFKWRQLGYAAAYELQLAKDSDFNTVVLQNTNIVPTDQLEPECYFPAGGLVAVPASGVAIAAWGDLEAGHTYYWRVRARVDVAGEAVRSPWSATMYFTVGAGFPVMAEYPTITLFSPPYGARDIPRSPAFSWSPMFKTAKYEFVLAKDAALQQVVVKTNVAQTSYICDEELDFNTSYFWQVRAIEPVVSDPSPIGTFTVVAGGEPVETEIEEPTPIPFWVWGVIAVCTALVAVMIAFAMVRPGRIRPRTAPVNRLEVIGDKPSNPSTMTIGGRQKAAPVDKLELPGEKSPNLIARIWNSITRGGRKERYSGKRGGGGLDDL